MQQAVAAAIGVNLTDGECIYLLHQVFHSRVDCGLTFKTFVKFLLVASAHSAPLSDGREAGDRAEAHG